MAIILTLDTSTKNCSVALFNGNKIIALKEQNSDGYTHAEQLTLFIEEVIKSANLTLKEIEAIAISKGPGSYTGLRIGTSTAKGLCYALDIPLISISTLKAMASTMAKNHVADIYCPMIDARRMEVFSGIYDVENNEINPFLHMGMHIALKEQVNSDRPIGINTIFKQIISRSITLHDAEHKMMECLGTSLWEAQCKNQLPDENEYMECLKRIS